MRMLMKVAIPNDGGNKALKEGTLGQIIGKFTEEHKPEAAYFTTGTSGERTALFFLDIKDSSQLVALSEPFFLSLNAHVTYTPVMNPQDLKSGLDKFKP